MNWLFKIGNDGGRGMALLNDHFRNHDTGFTAEERRHYRLEGLLPHATESLQRQAERVIQGLDVRQNDLERYIDLIGIADRNETLFYHTIMSDPARFVPILYTPTVGQACLEFGHIFRRPRGMYITRQMKGRMARVLRNWPQPDVRFICVSTGGRILGLGDIGSNGMGIPIGKLQLYTACAAVPPDCLLPILFDVGTTNAALRADPLYLGIREAPPPEHELDELVEEFIQAVQAVFPNCCVHFEDWNGADAVRLLERYRDRVLCYNDDIQGTASIVLAGLMTALQINKSAVTNQRILFVGAGSAATGIADLLVSTMQAKGHSQAEARSRIALFDDKGLVVADRPGLAANVKPYAQKMPASKPFDPHDMTSEHAQLVAAIDAFRPTALIGASTISGIFGREVVEAMSRLNDRPIIFALSNPTSKAECTAEQAYTWSKGKALYAAGVPFPEFTFGGTKFHPGQANNFYIFPAIGLATYVARPKRLTDECFIVAAQATADQVDTDLRAKGRLFPSQSNILETEVTTATRIAEFMFDNGLAQAERPADVRSWIEGQLYIPRYSA